VNHDQSVNIENQFHLFEIKSNIKQPTYLGDWFYKSFKDFEFVFVDNKIFEQQEKSSLMNFWA
jgi:hypothetical protein